MANILQSNWLAIAAKTLRNDLALRRYLRRGAESGAAFADRLAATDGQAFCFSVAFNAPWVVELLVTGWARFVSGAQLVVVDNSSDAQARIEIAAICKRAEIPYFGLPPYRERHISRSHAMALAWIYQNIVRRLQPLVFGFVDHDFIPIGPFDIAAHIADRQAFGVRWNQTTNYLFKGEPNGWFLWPGFAVWRYETIAPLKPNFLPQMEQGLDTAGRLWHSLYSKLPAEDFGILREERPTVELDGALVRLQIFDDSFLHVGGAGYLVERGKAKLIEPLRAYIAGTYHA